jgi:hypothetical protein
MKIQQENKVFSPTFNSQSAFTNKFPGLRSLCKTFYVQVNTLLIHHKTSTYISTVNIFKSSTNLIYKVLKVSISEWLSWSNDLMKICLHKLLHQITRRKQHVLMFAISLLVWNNNYLHFVELLQINNVHVDNRSDLFHSHTIE